jgi:hypothetical protein
MPMPIAKTAFINESWRTQAGLYVIVVDTDADAHLQALQTVLYRSQLRLHWRDESAKRRSPLARALCRLRYIGAVAITTGMASSQQDRARRGCSSAPGGTDWAGHRQYRVRTAARRTGRP